MTAPHEARQALIAELNALAIKYPEFDHAPFAIVGQGLLERIKSALSADAEAQQELRKELDAVKRDKDAAKKRMWELGSQADTAVQQRDVAEARERRLLEALKAAYGELTQTYGYDTPRLHQLFDQIDAALASAPAPATRDPQRDGEAAADASARF